MGGSGWISTCVLILEPIGFANKLDVEFLEKKKKLRMTPSLLAQTRKTELPCTVGGMYLKDGDFSLGHIKFSLGTGESISQK